MTSGHITVLIDLFLKSCGVLVLSVIAWRWKAGQKPLDRRFPPPRRRATDAPALRVYRRSTDDLGQEGTSIEFVQTGAELNRR